MATFTCPFGVLTFACITLVDLSDSEVSDSDDETDWYADVTGHRFSAGMIHLATSRAEYAAHVDGRIWCSNAEGTRELPAGSQIELSSDLKSVRVLDPDEASDTDMGET